MANSLGSRKNVHKDIFLIAPCDSVISMSPGEETFYIIDLMEK